MTISRPIHVAANGIISFFFMIEEYSIVHTYHIFFIHSFVDGHLGYFHVLAMGYVILFELFFSQIYAQEWDCWVIC